MKRVLSVGMVAFLSFVPAAFASVGSPPAGMSPIAGSLYEAQFALCSLHTIRGLALQEGVSLGSLAPRAAAMRLARSHDQDLGAAAVLGCRNGLLYRLKNDQAVSGLRSDVSSRVTAEKYVAAAYGVVMFGFFLYVLIHVSKVTRLTRETDELIRRLEHLARTDGPTGARL